VSGLTLAKYALALGGVVIVLAADRWGRPQLGWIGLGLILAAFFLRFWRHRKADARNGSTPES
jgi:predicted MFS family arabinose efflux permease